MPEPASRMISWPSEVLISTQAVLPPTRIVSGPGVGIVPRTPQNRTSTDSLFVAEFIFMEKARMQQVAYFHPRRWGRGLMLWRV
jgi:hypothetical protein